MDAYIISLNDSKELINDLSLKGFNAILFNGINGKKISIKDYTNNLTPFWETFGPKSAIGCGLSHLGVYKEFLKSKSEMCIVFEDDILYDNEYDNDIYDEINNAVKNVPKDFDIMYLGSITGNNNILNTILYPISNKEQDINDFIKIPKVVLGTHAYVLSKKGAEKLVNLKLFQHIDFCLQYLSSANIIKSYIVKQRIVYQSSANESNNSTNSTNKHPILINNNILNFEIDKYIKAGYITSVSCFRIPFFDLNLTLMSFCFLILGFIFRKKNLHSLLILFFIISIPDILIPDILIPDILKSKLNYTILHLILLIIPRILI
jgi:GR25 family glycosyltransferase involved in LPS biosynthesis